jgi:ribose transport system substrate-binding protein
MKKAILVVPLVLLLLAGCGERVKKTTTGVKPSKALQFAVLGKSIHPYWDEVKLGAEAAGKDLGVNVYFYVPPKEDVRAQISQLESYISMKVDGISFAASDPDAVTDTIKKALDMGIPCVAIDTDAPKSGRLAYIGTGNYEAGKIAGETMAKALNGKGKVVILTGSLTALNSLERMKGFKDAIAKYPGIKVIDTICDYEDESKAISSAEAALSAHPDLSGFYGVYAFDGPAAALAVERANKVGKVKIVCFDTTPEHMEYIKKGVITATIGQRPYMMGYLSVALLYNIAKLGQDKALMLLPKDRKIDTGVDIVTKDNLDEYRSRLQKLGIPVKW